MYSARRLLIIPISKFIFRKIVKMIGRQLKFQAQSNKFQFGLMNELKIHFQSSNPQITTSSNR